MEVLLSMLAIGGGLGMLVVIAMDVVGNQRVGTATSG